MVLLFTGFLCACSSSGTGLNFFSYEDEAEQGQKFAQEVEKNERIMADLRLNSYIRHLGDRLISLGITNPHFNYTFNVVDSAEVNAFAIPGGHLFVNLALLKEAASEAEIVGVIGHEIGHVVHRHGTKKMTDAILLQLAADTASQAIGQNTKGRLVGLGVGLFGQAGLLMYGRNAELEADHTGVDILYRTGYDVHAMVGFFEKLLAIEKSHGIKGGGLSELLATHPATSSRIHEAEVYISQLPRQIKPKENSPEFEEIRKYVAPMRPSPSKMTSQK